jgi:hypothetical protein
MIRYARYAAATGVALFTLVLVVLWIRSYFWLDVLVGPVGRVHASAMSKCGVIQLSAKDLALVAFPNRKWHVMTHELSTNPGIESWSDRLFLGFGYNQSMDVVPARLHFPHWLPVILTICWGQLAATKPTWRFSLRGLLVTLTLFTAAFGLLVYVL